MDVYLGIYEYMVLTKIIVNHDCYGFMMLFTSFSEMTILVAVYVLWVKKNIYVYMYFLTKLDATR